MSTTLIDNRPFQSWKRGNAKRQSDPADRRFKLHLWVCSGGFKAVLAICVMTLIAAAGGALAQSPEPATEPETQTRRVTVEARLTADGTPIEDGLEWRIFRPMPGDDGRLPELASASGGTKAFDMTPGEYFVHVAYGFAGAVRRITVDGGDNRQVFHLNAGGLKLAAVAEPDAPIPDRLLRFDVFSHEVDERGVRRLIARDMRPRQVVPFTAGTYHVVSRFGALNAETRADLRVRAGSLTEAVMQHRAARVTFRLVRQAGGDAIADTAWSILTETGDVIQESTSTFPSMVLAEGNYTAIARNAERIYSLDFSVSSGLNRDVEVLAEN